MARWLRRVTSLLGLVRACGGVAIIENETLPYLPTCLVIDGGFGFESRWLQLDY